MSGKYLYLHWGDLVLSDIDGSIAIHICYKFACHILLVRCKYHDITVRILCQNCVACSNSLTFEKASNET